MKKQLEQALHKMQTGQATNRKVADQFAMTVEEVNLLFVQFAQRQRRKRRLKHVLKGLVFWVDPDTIASLLEFILELNGQNLPPCFRHGKIKYL